MSRYKIGAVSYLNTKPLTTAMELGADPANMVCPVLREQDAGSVEFDLVYDLPSALADRLAAGELDVALVPSIALARPNPKTQQPYLILSDACIGCRGPVWSVKLLSRKPLAEIETLALDDGSRTSQCLVQILLEQNFNIRPELSTLEIDSDW